MDLTGTHSRHTARWAVVAAGAAIVAIAPVALGALPAGATTETTTPPEDTSTAPDDTTTTTIAVGTTPASDEPTTTSASPTTAAATTTAAPTASSAEFTATLDAECEGDTGHQLLASGLQVVIGTDGSLRIVEIALACDIEFVGPIDETLGRPTTNVEALIADPANNVTPNQAQTDLLNTELSIYWRIADAWAQAADPAAGVTTTVVSDVATSGPEESATTGG